MPDSIFLAEFARGEACGQGILLHRRQTIDGRASLIGFKKAGSRMVRRFVHSAQQVGERGRTATIWYMDHVDASHHLEKLT